MEIQNPRRILAVSLTESANHLSRVIQDLSDSQPLPSPPQTSLAGTTHNLPLTTQYYTASIPIWLDLVGSPSEWASSFLTPEAKEVLDALGGLILVFNISSGTKAQNKEFIGHVGKVVREGLGGWEWDGVLLAIGVGDLEEGERGEEEMDEWEDVCTEWGLEFVHVPVGGTHEGGKRNEFGEKMGVERAREALMANDWTGAGGGGGEEGEDEDMGEFDPDRMEFGFEREELAGLRRAIWSAGKEGEEGAMEVDGAEDEEMGEEDVQKLERMIGKLQAVRERGEGLSEEQRKRLAKQAVGEVMKEL